MDDNEKCLHAFNTRLSALAGCAAGKIRYDLLLQQTGDLRHTFEEIQKSFSGYWGPVEDSLLYLETLIKNRFEQAVVMAGIQQLVCISSLVLYTYWKGSRVILKADRCRFVFPAVPEGGPHKLTAVFVFGSAADASGKSAYLNGLRADGISVAVIVQSGAAEDLCLPEGIKAVCLPMPLSLPALFELAYYLCDTGLLLFSYDCLWRRVSVGAAAGALRADSSLAYVLLEKADADTDRIVPGFPEGSLSGVYRKSAVGKIGAPDCLFSEERFLCEDYHIRAEALDFTVGTLGCTGDDVPAVHFPLGINRDGEALLRKHGRELKPKLDKAFIHEFSHQLCGKLQNYESAVLYHDGDDRMAAIMSGYLSDSGMARASDIRVMDIHNAQEDYKAELAVFCFPMYRHRGFDGLLDSILKNGITSKAAFFDINYAAGDSLEKVLADRSFEGSGAEAFTIYFRKSLRDRITGNGWDVSFSRVTRNVPGRVETALRMMFPDSCDMMLRNLQTKYYAYVCSRL